MPTENTTGTGAQAPIEGTKNLQDMMMRMALGFAINLLARKIKQRQLRRKALHKAEKLSSKGKKIPSSVQKDMVKGLGRRGRRKQMEKIEREGTTMKKKKAETEEEAEVEEKAKKKKSKIGKLLRLAILAVAVVLIVRLVKSQQVNA